jgi:hypothetical protein
MAGDLASNSLAFGVSNNGGNKLDSFLHIDVDLNDAASREASPWDIAGTVTVTNTATGHEPDYVAGQVASRPRSEYQGFHLCSGSSFCLAPLPPMSFDWSCLSRWTSSSSGHPVAARPFHAI